MFSVDKCIRCGVGFLFLTMVAINHLQTTDIQNDEKDVNKSSRKACKREVPGEYRYMLNSICSTGILLSYCCVTLEYNLIFPN